MAIVQIINRSGGTSDTGGGGSTTLKIENLSSQVTGSNINFSTSSQFVDYTEDGDRRGVTFALAPETGSKVVVIYSESA